MILQRNKPLNILGRANNGKPITAVRYAWADNPGILNLVNSEGLLARPFRTNDYKDLISNDTGYDKN